MMFVIRFAEFLLCRFQWISVYLFTVRLRIWKQILILKYSSLLYWASHSSELGSEQEWTKILYMYIGNLLYDFLINILRPGTNNPFIYVQPTAMSFLQTVKLLCHWDEIAHHWYSIISNLLMLQNKMCLLNKNAPKLWPFLNFKWTFLRIISAKS